MSLLFSKQKKYPVIPKNANCGINLNQINILFELDKLFMLQHCQNKTTNGKIKFLQLLPSNAISHPSATSDVGWPKQFKIHRKSKESLTATKTSRLISLVG